MHAADEVQSTDAAGATADKYIRETVFLATVLFLVGISGRFRIRAGPLRPDRRRRALLVFAVVQLAEAARTAVVPPGAPRLITPFGRCESPSLLLQVRDGVDQVEDPFAAWR